jgi:DUF438 domain-containing protein
MADRTELLRDYVKRLSEGEDLETVRADFVKNFSDVDAAEIAKAEQTLIESGTPISDVQRLCDVHSALFHGATRQEQIDNAEKAVQESLSREQQEAIEHLNKGKAADTLHRTDGADDTFEKLRQIEGHPLQIFYLENQAVEKQLKEMRKALSEKKDVLKTFDKTRQIAVHYAKKGDLLYPVLKKDYGFSGPSDVMWGVDDEIRDEMKTLYSEAEKNADRMEEEAWQSRMDKVLTRAEEMVYKENNILLPLCAKNFSEEVWKGIARDMKDYEFCLIEPVSEWKDAAVEARINGNADEIVLPSGHFSKEQLNAMLDTIPLEITFIDDDDINRYFNQNEGTKLFKRPLAALDREVYTCHPPKVEPMVRMVISELKSGEKDSIDIWNERGGEPVLIRYMAVRDKDGKYQGTMEVVQHMGFARDYFSQR